MSGNGIEARHLTVRFGSFVAIDDVSFDVHPGEFVTLLGPSGCGKTTLLRLLSGFLAPATGTVHIGGRDVTTVPPERRDTALCFQSYALFPHLTVRENLEFGLVQRGVPRSERRTRIDDVASTLELDAQLGKMPNQLSGGQQQRVALGRALAMRPSVILFDEPLSNLDAKLRDAVRVEIRRIQRSYGLTAIYVTHDQSEALAMSDRVLVMHRGTIEQSDRPEVLYREPRTRFVADFIGAANLLHGTVAGRTPSGLAQVHTALGLLAVDHPAVRDAVDGTAVHLCFRPEAATLGSATPGAIQATVLDRAFQGHFTDLTVDAGGSTFRVRVRDDDAREGDVVHVHVASDALVVLEDEA